MKTISIRIDEDNFHFLNKLSKEESGDVSKGSYAVTDWNVGSKALFLSPQGEGMVSRIVAHRPNEFLSIEHLGIVKNGVEDTKSEAVKAWAGLSKTIRSRKLTAPQHSGSR
jgi:hypothetical protein